MSDRYEDNQKHLYSRNPFEPTSKHPITAEMCHELWQKLGSMWEDTNLVTEPNQIAIGLDVGNLRHILLLAAKGAEKE